jgi:competence ComEA-like helix-hairpin-helix protein
MILSLSRIRTISFAFLLALPGVSLIGCVRRSNHQAATRPDAIATTQHGAERININNASTKDLERLPGIGTGLAQRIVEHREKYGRFRRPEHLIMVRGVSDRRFRELRDLITIE